MEQSYKQTRSAITPCMKIRNSQLMSRYLEEFLRGAIPSNNQEK